jgi:hypothetical protein
MLLKPWKLLFNNGKKKEGGGVIVEQSFLQQDQ